MLAIRLQRLGRKAMPVYRVAVQESHRHPTSGRVVAYVGAYNPHTKELTLDKEKVEYYLKNGAQPTPRVVRLLESDKITLPSWVVKTRTDKKYATRKPEKLRKNQPAAPAEPVAEDTTPPEASATDAADTADESPSEDKE